MSNADKAADNRMYVHGSGDRVLLYHPGRTAVSTFNGNLVWVENLRTPALAQAFVERQNEILAIAATKQQERYDAAGIDGSVEMARMAAWTYRMATDADAYPGKARR